MAVDVHPNVLWRVSKSLVKYVMVLLIAFCALYGALSILGLFFLASEAPCLGVNAYQIGDQCYYE